MSEIEKRVVASRQPQPRRSRLRRFFAQLSDIDPSDDPRELTPYERNRLDSFRALLFLLSAMAMGVLFIVLFAIGLAATFGEFLRIATIGTMIAAASFAGGIMLGFLFGIPRTMQQEHSEADVVAGGTSSYRANTNLEQISDWLTKILVGVGLTQIGELPGAVRGLGDFLVNGVSGKNDAFEVFSVLVVAYFIVCGFLFSYLWARLFMGAMLQLADTISPSQVRREITEAREKEEDVRARALELAQKQLEHSGKSPVTQEQLDAIMQKARRSTLLEVFDRAREVRRQAWRERDPNAERIGRTIPVFLALAKTETEGVLHRTWGEIGFALKDMELAARAREEGGTEWMEESAWQQAVDALNRAIEIRDVQRDRVGHLYEVNRVTGYMVLDPDFRQGKPTSDPQRFQQIVDDLMWAVKEHHDWMFKRDLRNPEWMSEYEITQDWLRLNAAMLPPELQAEIRTPEEAYAGVAPGQPIPPEAAPPNGNGGLDAGD